MKILAAGDIHGDSRLAERLAKKAKKNKVDLVVLCGDLTQFDSSTANIIGPFKKRNQKVIFVPGNHDSAPTADFLAEAYQIRNLHSYSVKYKDVGLFGCGFANIGLSQIPEDEIFDILKKSKNYIKDAKKKIMVTHVHPDGSLMGKLSNLIPGSKGVKKAIDKLKPDILLCSHVHEAEGVEEKIGNTKVINVGREGKIIQL
ncbi:MAG: metallophosphoesterase family protein [Nanoarchaeota archaeon]|nr:metallophosphoesterase family protein [Nanoarchaeota archaeon]MCG2718778.1 metallophosphoesterase family protein [Nanoarchaeota archaeon]